MPETPEIGEEEVAASMHVILLRNGAVLVCVDGEPPPPLVAVGMMATALARLQAAAMKPMSEAQASRIVVPS